MALKKTIEELKDLLQSLQIDLEKAEKGNKAASQRVRTGTVRLEKVAKNYRKESIAQEKTAAPKKAPAKKTKAAARPFAIRKSTAKIPAKAKTATRR